MWTKIGEWLLTTAKLVNRQEAQQQRINEMEGRIRDLEEAVRILTQEARHAREMEAAEREKLLLRLENAVQSARLALPNPKRRKRKGSAD